jgi:hypothetical protein
VPLNISLAGTGTLPVSTQWSLSYSTTDFSSISVVAGSAATNKSLSCEYSAGIAICMLWGLNDTSMATGVVATVSLTVSSSTKDLSSLVQLTNGVSASTAATADSTSTSNGTVTILQAPSLNGFSCNPTSISPSAGSTCTVALTEPAGSGGTTIKLSSSPADVNMPTTVTVPQSSSSTMFSVTAGNVDTPTPVTLTASLSGVKETFGLTVNPPPAALSAVSATPGTIVSGNSATGTVTLTAAAPTGGALVVLSSSNTSAATVPASVMVAAGATSANFTVTAGSVTAATPVTLSAMYSGLTATFGLTINAPLGIATNVSVTPNSGSLASQSFTLQYSDTSGAAGLQTVWMYINTTLASPASNACLLYYNMAANVINLAQDSGTTWVTSTPGTATTLQNSQCSLSVAGTAVTRNGNTLTLTLPITFAAGFAGAKNIYMYAADVSGTNSGWQPLGSWTVPESSGPAPVSVTPNSGSLASQSFTLQYSDTSGAASLQTVWVYINATFASPASNACLLYYNMAANVINLAQDSGTTWVTSTPGTATTLQNSQCSLSVAGTTVTRNGNTLTLTLPITFAAGFAGAKNIYMYAADVSGTSSGWQPLGTWTVPGSSGPAPVSVTPSSGSLASQNFTLQYSDTSGAASLQTVWVYINATFASPASNACLLYYNMAANVINLAQDSGTTWVTSTPGTATTLQNSQCSLSVAGTMVTRNGNTLTLTLPITFAAGFAGAKNIYMYAADVSGTNSGWQPLGTWTVPGSSGPAPVSVTPSSGSLASQSFTLQYSDTSGAASLQTVWVYINTTLASPASNACLLYYNLAANVINLAQDSGTTWVTSTPGTATTLQNSQCSLNVAGTMVTRNGNTLTLTLPITFAAGFAGAKNTYMYAADVSGTNSGWQLLGSWTVP